MGDAHSRAGANTCAGEQSGPLIDMHISSFSMASTRRAFLAPLVSGALALVSSMSFAEAVASPETAEAEAAGADGQLATVTVTARNRSESAQDVPIPMSILQSSDLVRDNTVSIQDLTQKAPGLEATTPNSRRTGISLRGIGKSAGNDALEASVGVLVDGIFLSHPGMTYQDFTDLEQVEVHLGSTGSTLAAASTLSGVTENVQFAHFGYKFCMRD